MLRAAQKRSNPSLPVHHTALWQLVLLLTVSDPMPTHTGLSCLSGTVKISYT